MIYMRILFNGINLDSSGGLSVGRNLLRALDDLQSPHTIQVLVSDVSGLASDVNARNIEVIELQRRGPRLLWRVRDDLHRIPAECKRRAVDVCFSLGDLGPAHLSCPHVVLVHNPWLLYETADIAARLTHWERLIYREGYSRWFRRMCPGLAVATVQTPVVAKRLLARFPLAPHQVKVIPSACTVKPVVGEAEHPAPAAAGGPIQLLFLAQYYPHKNHAILPYLLLELARRKALHRFHFTLTISERNPRARRLLHDLRQFSSHVTNCGPLSEREVPHYLSSSHALFLPTLLETFGLVYLEAMACGTAILTSDRDFSRHVCGDYARFFEPTDAMQIADALLAFSEQSHDRAALRSRGARRLKRSFLGWNDVASAYLEMLEAAAG